MQKRAVVITTVFVFLTLLASPGYWMAAALSRFSGPEDDIAIVYCLSPFILLHAFLTSRAGFRVCLGCSTAFALVVVGLCLARHFEIAPMLGYDRWHANRSLESLAWSLFWFVVGLIFCVFPRFSTDPARKA